MKSTATTTNIITLDFQNHAIPFTTDAHVNLTEMCAAFGKRPAKFLELESTRRFIVALAADTGLSLDFNYPNSGQLNCAESPYLESSKCPESGHLKNLLVTLRGQHGGGTWAHPDLALECARWLSPEFAIWTNRAIRKLLSGECQHNAQDVRTLARLQSRLKEINEEAVQIRRRITRMTLVAGNVSVWAYLAAAGNFIGVKDKALRMRVAIKSRTLSRHEGHPIGKVKQGTYRLWQTNHTFPPHVIYRVLIDLGFPHKQPPLRKIYAAWQTFLPLAERTALITLKA
jgi:hypothetical protein